MTVEEFFDGTPGFYNLAGPEKILAACWFLHNHSEKELFSRKDLRECFRRGGVEAPDISVYLPRLEARKPPPIIRSQGGYRLAGETRKKLDAKFGTTQSVVAVSALLAGLPEQIPNIAERDFLKEALACYRVKAYRASIVMTWNLAFDHLCNWILNDATRLAAFNASLRLKDAKKPPVTVRTDFDEMKESTIIELGRAAKLLPKNVAAILSEKLNKRNRAAHPSSVAIGQLQADEIIADLVGNVVLILK